MKSMFALVAVACLAFWFNYQSPAGAQESPATTSSPASRPLGLPEGLPAWVYQRPGSVSTQPVEREEKYARKAHERYLAQVADVKAGKTKIDLLFIGDSITAGWGGQKKLFAEKYGPFNAAAFGVGGDHSSNVLWRLAHGEIDGLSPKVVVLLIGANQMGDRYTVQDVIDGNAAVIKVLREKLPDAKILHIGVFPEQPNPKVSFLEKIKETNAGLAKLADGKNVRFIDFGDKLLVDGKITKEFFLDRVHLTDKGYVTWAREMHPLLLEMMGAPATEAASEPATKPAP